jgi:hypothetical protein
MSKWSADAPNAGKSSESSVSEHGTRPAPSSGLDGLTLFERLMLAQMKELNETLGYMAFLMGEHADLEEDAEPGAQTRDMAGRPIQ